MFNYICFHSRPPLPPFSLPPPTPIPSLYFIVKGSSLPTVGSSNFGFHSQPICSRVDYDCEVRGWQTMLRDQFCEMNVFVLIIWSEWQISHCLFFAENWHNFVGQGHQSSVTLNSMDICSWERALNCARRGLRIWQCWTQAAASVH